MTAPLPCLASVDALLGATPAELGAAVLVCGFADRLDEPHPQTEMFQLIGAVVAVLGITDARPGTRGYYQALQDPANAEIPFAVDEGVLAAEQRLCVVRSFGSSSERYVTLLRRGHDALRHGDPGRYLS